MIVSSIRSCSKIGIKSVYILIVLCASVYSLIGMCEEDYKKEIAQQMLQQQLEKRQSAQKHAPTIPVKTPDGKKTNVPLWQIPQIETLSERFNAQKNENSVLDISDVVMQKVVVGSKNMVDVKITASMLENLVTAFNKGLVSQYSDFFTKLDQEDKNNLINTAEILGADRVIELSKYVMLPKEINEAIYREVGFEDKGKVIANYLKSFEKKVFSGYKCGITCMARSFNGECIVLGMGDGKLILQNVYTGKYIRIFEGHKYRINCVACSPDGTSMVSVSSENLIVWDIHTGKQKRSFEVDRGGFQCVAYSPDGNHIVAGAGDNTLRLWNAHTGEQIKIYKFNTSVDCVAYSPNGRYIIFGLYNNIFNVLDVHEDRQIRTFGERQGVVGSVAFSPDGKYVASTSKNYIFKLWNMETGEEIRDFKGHLDSIRSIIFSSDGKYVVSASDDRTLILWDVETGKKIRDFKGHTDWVQCVVYSVNGEYIISGAYDKKVIIWFINGKMLEYIEKKLTVDQQNFVYRLCEATARKKEAVIDPADPNYDLYYLLPENIKKLLHICFLFSISELKHEESNSIFHLT